MIRRTIVWGACVFTALLFVSPVYAAHTNATTKNSKYDIAPPVLFGVTPKNINPDFGDSRGGGTRTHEGQDIMAPEGIPIVSPVKATVMSFGTAASPGKYVYTKGADGHLYWYMHLDEIAKLKRGQKLNIGDLIGTLGDTGNAKGTVPHLHFEIRKNGKPIDPYPRIKKEFSLEDKITYLNAALKDLKDDDGLVERMVAEYSGLLLLAQAEEMSLDRRFVTALKKVTDVPIASTTIGLRKGSEGSSVRALQNALIKANMGPNAYSLAQAGSTGYFGSITEVALREYQERAGITETGVYDEATRAHLHALTQLVYN